MDQPPNIHTVSPAEIDHDRYYYNHRNVIPITTNEMESLHNDQAAILNRHYEEGRAKNDRFGDQWVFHCMPRQIQRPNIVNFGRGNITVTMNNNKMSATDISQQILECATNEDYSFEKTRFLAVRQFRMLFQNMLEEPNCTVSHTMPPMKKEIDRMFLRVIQQHEKESETSEVPPTINDIHTYDMPYRCKNWVYNLSIVCTKILEGRHSPELIAYLQYIIHSDSTQIKIEEEYNAREKRCQDRNLDFAQMIDFFHYEKIQHNSI